MSNMALEDQKIDIKDEESTPGDVKVKREESSTGEDHAVTKVAPQSDADTKGKEQAPKKKSEDLYSNYSETLTELEPEAKELLVKYAKFPDDDQLLPHVHKMREKAWNRAPYGCVGRFSFTQPGIHRPPNYSRIMERIKAGDKFLDLGCGFGQNIRKLVFDGAPAENVFGADISRWLIDCGYEYFQDRETLKSKFIIGDILNENSESFTQAKGTFDIVFASLFYHLWDWDKQLEACIETTKLLKPVPGSTLYGWQLGSDPPGEVEKKSNRVGGGSIPLWHHDEASWKRMWKEIEKRTGTNWEVMTRSREYTSIKGRQNTFQSNDGSKLNVLGFSMTRL